MADAADRLQITTQFNRALRQESLQPETPRPTASPVDQFTAPQAGDQLEQLAQGLAKVSPDVAQYSDQLAKQGQERDQADAVAQVSDAVRNGATTYAAAVKSGAIPASASPWYRLYAKKQFGQLMAGQMTSDFTAASAKDLSTATDLKQYDAYAQSFQKQWLDTHAGEATNDPAFSDGFNPSANAAMANQRERFADAAGQRLQQYTGATLSQNVAQIQREGKSQGMADADIVAKINQSATDAMGAGMNGDAVNGFVAQGLVTAAENAGDVGILKLASSIKAGTGVLGDTVAFRQAADEATKYITSSKMTADMMARNDRTARTEAARDTNLTAAFTALDANPHADIRTQLAALAAVNDYAGEEQLRTWQTAKVAQAWSGDKTTEGGLMADALGGSLDMGTIARHLHSGDDGISLPAADMLRGIVQAQQNKSEVNAKINSTLTDPNYKVQAKVLADHFAGLNLPSDRANLGNALQYLYEQATLLQQADPEYAKNPRSPQSIEKMKQIEAEAVMLKGGPSQQATVARSQSAADNNAEAHPGIAKRTLAEREADPDYGTAQDIAKAMGSGKPFDVITAIAMRRLNLTTPQKIHDYLVKHGAIAAPTTAEKKHMDTAALAPLLSTPKPAAPKLTGSNTMP